MKNLLSNAMAVIRAEIHAYICWLRNVKSLLFFMTLWPYLMAGLLLGLGSIIGSLEEYKARMGVVNPIFYLIASGGVMVSSIAIIDSVVGSALEHRWLGTLPYIASSPPGMVLVITLGPIPRSLISCFITLTSVMPAAIYFEGLMGSAKIFLLLMIIYLAMIPLIGLSIILAGLTLLAGEETNIASFLTPFMLLVSGVFYPQTILPWILRVIAAYIPVSYVVEAAKLMAAYHIPPLKALLTLSGIILGLAVIYNAISIPGVAGIGRVVMRRGIHE